MSQNDRTQLIPDPQQPSRHTGGVQSPRPIAPSRGQQRGAANVSQRPNKQHQQRQTNGNAPKQPPTHARGDRGPARKPAENNKSAYPNTTIAGVDVSFSNASSAATKVNSAWKHYKLTVTGDDFSWTYQPESDEPIVDGEAAAKEIISRNEAIVWPVRLVESLSGKTKTTASSNEVDLD